MVEEGNPAKGTHRENSVFIARGIECEVCVPRQRSTLLRRFWCINGGRVDSAPFARGGFWCASG
jgi:hypothetical protein